ncbi:L,D-transpeptidase family protein [Phenylobacterium soli]|uniref:Murein L,D-transpeptidase n=1 Tax=Phenylobacterium soli TaxID=2170551 RepID=A0A328AMJ1_9CAUL|nr:L,D-transpeptidase family protein [Phenylobacterium soli]RAK54108.1 murein L,D-transpeptidase [Phenylobacterium soli]
MARLILILAAGLLLVLGGARANAQPASPLSAADRSLLLATLRAAPEHGLPASEARLKAIERDLAAADPAQRVQAEAELRVAVIAYARAQRGLRVPTSRFLNNWAIRPPPYDAEAELAKALATSTLAAWLAGLPPQEPRYAALVRAYARYRAIGVAGGWPALPSKTAKPGAVGPEVAALRRRLAVEDGTVVVQGERYDATLSAAVSRAQARYGLNVDGVAGPSTLAALNVPVAARLAQIRANLERWRWAPRTLPGDRVELNIAGAWFDEYEGGDRVLSMRAVVGRPQDQTPSFMDHIHAVVFYPPWNVPARIAQNELWPKERRQPGYLASQGIRVLPGGRLQQAPGPKNSLGLMKFELDDPYAVYFHDTPARSLFAREYRFLSHGCMRLERPYDLARRLLRNDPDWTGGKIDAALKAGFTQRAPMTRVMAYVFYWTAFVDDDGQMQFRPDAYRWDQALLGMLGD